MINIRLGVFETNSSSTHSLVICPDSEYESWKTNKVLYVGDMWTADKELLGISSTQDFVSVTDLIEIIKSKKDTNEDVSDKFKDFIESEYTDFESLLEYEIYTFTLYFDVHENLEYDEYSYVTPGGEKLKVLCHYGYDG